VDLRSGARTAGYMDGATHVTAGLAFVAPSQALTVVGNNDCATCSSHCPDPYSPLATSQNATIPEGTLAWLDLHRQDQWLRPFIIPITNYY